MNISTNFIIKAISYYSQRGFKLIDVPLIIDTKISEWTKPIGVPDLNHVNDKVYIASAEQSFLQLFYEKKLPEGRYIALTPCYRHEGILDDTHFRMFLKLELLSYGCGDSTFYLAYQALSFMRQYCNCQMIDTIIGTDIEDSLHSIELGSYGERRFFNSKQTYIYGTGIAEPRFSYVVNKQKELL